MKTKILIYGSYGYTGQLIVKEALKRGMNNLVLSGRNAEALSAQAQENVLPFVACRIDESEKLLDMMSECSVVIHCAGPFAATVTPMIQACLASGTHYLDISGEYDVFETLKKQDAALKTAGICALGGAGFDVVPSDCLAARLKESLPTANKLELAFKGLDGGLSPGTAKTSVAGMGRGGVVRQGGILKTVAIAHKSQTVDFGKSSTMCACIPWGDISTAYTSTGIPDIEVYMAVNRPILAFMKASDYFGGLMATDPAQKALNWLAGKVKGPGPEVLERSKSYFWGRVSDAQGRAQTMRLQTPGGYRLTAMTAVEIALRFSQNTPLKGYHTPATAFGSGFIEEFEGCRFF